MSSNLVPATEPKRPRITKLPVAVGNRGVELRNIDEAYRFAEAVCQSGLAPTNMPNPQAVLVAIQLGLEVGLPPMAALQNIAVINGRPAIWGDGMLAVCRVSGIFNEEVFDERIEGGGDEMVACCTVGRIGGKPLTRQFSVQDAKTAGLWGGRQGKSSPWQTYPKRMLQMRARSWALRDAFADVLRGMYAREEAEDIPPQAPPAISHVQQADAARQKRGAEQQELPPPDPETVAESRQAVEEGRGGPIPDDPEPTKPGDHADPIEAQWAKAREEFVGNLAAATTYVACKNTGTVAKDVLPEDEHQWVNEQVKAREDEIRAEKNTSKETQQTLV